MSSHTSMTSSSSTISRSSTPPTEVSEASEFVLPPDTDESRRRREQSDAASSAIGERLLKGWAMLAEECPAPTCFGVPLVRPPKAGRDKDPRKECVICGTVYLTEVDWAGREILVPEKQVPAPQPVATPAQVQPVEKLPNRSEPTSSQVVLPFFPGVQTQSTMKGTLDTMTDTLDQSINGLEDTLRVLTSRLAGLTAGQADSSSIANVADAISKVVQAISQVKQLQWAETRAKEAL
ncbi:hypothetical protein C8F01DRAFT_1117230 [Mycena amicta]|nr:hypothetical protein C8F01DRAFT_1117230 [Mycena amicta]